VDGTIERVKAHAKKLSKQWGEPVGWYYSTDTNTFEFAGTGHIDSRSIEEMQGEKRWTCVD